MKRRALSALVSWLVAAPILSLSANVYSQATLPTVPVFGAVPSDGDPYSGVGGGGGGGWGGVGTTVPDEDNNICAIIASQNEPGCDLNNPPELIVNGCGSDGSAWVPDGMPDNPTLFRRSCDAHDQCYGGSGQSKPQCDGALRDSMYTDCEIYPEGSQSRNDCRATADIYESVLSSGMGSDSAFDRARFEMRCRERSSEYLGFGC